MTSKKSLFVLALSLFLATFSTLNAQSQGKPPKFTVTAPVPDGTVTVLSAEESAKLNLRDASELTAEELTGVGLLDNVNFATAFTGANCLPLPGFVVPVNTCLTSNPASWRSFRFGCTRTVWWPGPNCVGGAFVFSGFPQDTCIQANPVTAFGSIACLTP